MAADRIVAIVGQTASGKSSLAIDIAKEFNGEIIAADSRTVYRYLDIGTAKPTQEELATLKHHCINLAEPDERFTAYQFQQEAKNALAQIRERNKLPIVVGGTGLYVDSLLYSFEFGGQEHNSSSSSRDEIESMSLADLQKKALEIDGTLNSSLLKNKRHLVRLIERGKVQRADYPHLENLLIVGIFPPKSSLRNNIQNRVELMFKRGLRKEVDELVSKYGWESEAMTGIGYREFKEFYDGQISMSKVKRNIVSNTLKYAKRQKTWFKRNPNLVWFDDANTAGEYIRDKLSQN